MHFHTFNCPYCNTELELIVQRWTTEEECPQCDEIIVLEYDMIVMEDEEGNIEEFDLIFPKKLIA